MKILYFGITQFATRGLKKLIQMNKKPIGLVILPIASQDIENMKLICQDYHIPVYNIGNVNDPEFLNTVQNTLKPDVILTFTFSQKLSPQLITSAKYAINMHPSFLPYYRGNNPYFWPIANGETSTGVSFHYLNEAFDEGDIIMQDRVPIYSNDTSGLVINRQEDVAVEMLEKILNMIEGGVELPRIPQEQGDFPKAPKPNLPDFFINWEWPTDKILNRIRALNPYTGAYAQFKNSVLAIYQAAATSYGIVSEPGTIVALSPEGPLVKTGNGAIILRVLTSGKKFLLSGNDFIELERVQVGDKLVSWGT